jgi:hypothetical protein
MKQRANAQVSTEILFSIVFLLAVFVMMLLLVQQNQQSNNTFQQNMEEEESCSKVSSIITYMSVNPPYTETQFELLRDLNIVNGLIFVGDIFCPFFGSASNVQLYPGVIRAFDINGVVVFTNDVNYNPFNPPTDPPASGSDVTEGAVLLIDDQGNTWNEEVEADDVSYAISEDDLAVDPDWVEFRFPSLGLTSADIVTSVFVLIKHFESNLAGAENERSMFQCQNHDTNAWINIEPYTPSFTELLYFSPDLSSCITDWDSANNARVRMTYEPNGTGDQIFIDYGRIDVNFSVMGFQIDLWEHKNDLPQPVDFRTDVNSTQNTFEVAGNDGWDWNKLTYGGSLENSVLLNADPNMDGNIADSNVNNAGRLEIKLGGGVIGAVEDPDDNSTVGPVVSGAYGIQFDINSELYSAVQTGSTALLSFTYTVDADGAWGNTVDAGEEAWVKARFGLLGSQRFLGSDLDATDNDADATPELYWADSPADVSNYLIVDVSSLITNSGTYYLDIGGALSDWDASNEGIGIYLDNINLVIV